MAVTDSASDIFQESEISLPRPLRFWLFLTLVIPSVYCSSLLLFHLFVNKKLRSQLNNHIVINLIALGLIIELIDIPLHLSFLHTGFIQPSTPFLCLVWMFLDIGLYNGCVILMAWGSVQRYLLIFNERLFLTAKKRFLLHALPLIIFNLYFLVFYFVVIVFPPCVNTYDYTLPVCNDFPCYLADPFLGIWDSVVNGTVPTIIITVFSVAVVIRVYLQKRRLNQRHLWRKQRKMTIQLLSMCILYLAANIPLNVTITAHLVGLPDQWGANVETYSDFLCYFVTLLFPFVCLGSLSELRKKIGWKGLLLFRTSQQTAVIDVH